MKYELDLFFRIIHHDLLRESNDLDFTDHFRFLQNRFIKCSKHYKVQYIITSTGEYVLHQINEYAFLDLQGMIYQESPSKNNQQLLDSILSQFLSKVAVSKKAITNAQYFKTNEELELEITVQLDFLDLHSAEAKFHYYKTLLQDEVERIKQRLHHQVFCLQSEKKITLYIQNYQLELENLMQTLLHYLNEESWERIYTLSGLYTLEDIHKISYQYLEKLQRHIEQYFTKYLDVTISISYHARLVGLREINDKVNTVFRQLLESDLDEKLVKLTKKMLVRLTHISPDARISYQSYLYLKILLNELYTLSRGEQKLTNEVVAETLYRLNVNSVDFFTYFTSKIQDDISHQERIEEKLVLLYFHQKIYRQQQVKLHSGYQKGLFSIKVQILDWIKEEISYLKKIARQNPAVTKTEEKPGGNKITTQLSVSQIAYMLKVMHEMGLITAKSQWDMFRFLQENVSSKRSDTISAHSLNNKYYHVEYATKASVKNLLLKMLHYINKT